MSLTAPTLHRIYISVRLGLPRHNVSAPPTRPDTTVRKDRRFSRRAALGLFQLEYHHRVYVESRHDDARAGFGADKFERLVVGLESRA